MDNDRQMRFLIPPFVLLASLLWGVVLDSTISVKDVMLLLAEISGASAVVPVIIGGGIAVVAMGYILSTISVFALRMGDLVITLFKLRKRSLTPWIGHEACVSDETLKKMKIAIGLPDNKAKNSEVTHKMLYTVAAFHHNILPERLDQWGGRRWNSFMVSVNCIIAILVSWPIGYFSGRIAWTDWWLFTGACLCLLLGVNAYVAWKQTMEMLEFLSLLPWEGSTGESRDSTDSYEEQYQ